MSAFVVSDEHLGAILRYAAFKNMYAFGKNVRGNEQEIGMLLLTENYISVEARYPKIYTERRTFHYIPFYATRPLLKPIEFIKLCQSLAYQSSEHDAYDSSDAGRAVRGFISTAISRLEGYEDAPWSI